MGQTRTRMPAAAVNNRPRGPGVEECPDDTVVSPAAQAQGICLRLLTSRSRSRAELAEALHKRGISEEVGNSILDRLDELGLVNDTAFAEATVHSGHTYRGLGGRALRAELRRRGVPDEIARDAVETVRPEDEEQRARELVRRKLRGSTVRDASTLARKLSAMLARKGYSEGLTWRVVREELGPDTRSGIASYPD